MTDKTFEKYKLLVDEHCVNGFNGRKAYQKFYPKASNETADVEFSRILSIPKVADYKRGKQQNTATKLQITLEGQILELDDIRMKAKEDNRFGDAINAVKEQNKLLALYEEHNKQKNPLMSEEEKDRRLDELIAKITHK